MKKRFLVTGSAGFIGFHLCELLLKDGNEVIGFDSLTDYYDKYLKIARLEKLTKNKNFIEIRECLTNLEVLEKVFSFYNPNAVVHLAAQAGVRYSLENPRSYLDSNIVGTFNILENIKKFKTPHTLIASTSSVYGANTEMPFNEKQKTETQLSFYAATKKACEVLSHSYSHIYNLPITNFRFFTVYGPWGRPDMALFKFVKAIRERKPIDIYNNGKMKRDFTYIKDLVKSISLLIDCVPQKNNPISDLDTLSSVAPWRVVNIGNSKAEELLNFITEIENCLGSDAIRNYLPMQKGDVEETFADCNLLFSLTGYRPNTEIKKGIKKFCEWYVEYYGKK